MDDLKKKQRDEMDRFDADMQSIYDKMKQVWAFYAKSNLEAETTTVVEAQRRVCADIQVAVQETEIALAKLQLEHNGKCNIHSTDNL